MPWAGKECPGRGNPTGDGPILGPKKAYCFSLFRTFQNMDPEIETRPLQRVSVRVISGPAGCNWKGPINQDHQISFYGDTQCIYGADPVRSVNLQVKYSTSRPGATFFFLLLVPVHQETGEKRTRLPRRSAVPVKSQDGWTPSRRHLEQSEKKEAKPDN